MSKWAILLGTLLLACEPSPHGQTADSQTNWLRACQIDSQCGGLSCVCGICTNLCSKDAACAETRGGSCVLADDPGVIAQCGGVRPPGPGLCMSRCEAGACSVGQMCVAGLCTPLPTPSAKVSVDTGRSHQVLVGFGASLAYVEADITAHPLRTQLLDSVLNDMGLDVLRLRNRYVDSPDVSNTGELVAAATAALGHTPGIFLTSWSPPAALKGSAALFCSGNPTSCTLNKTPQGAFDYQGFAQYWRTSLEAYAKVGVVPDYIGLQNNPNWVPTAADYNEACKFLPVEGTAMVTVADRTMAIEYPGLAEAHKATSDALVGLASRPKLLGPETSGFAGVADYASALDLTEVDAFAHHLYGSDPAAIDAVGLAGLAALSAKTERPVFMTEMQADGFGTALLLHYATVTEGASVYLQSALIGSLSGPAANTQALIGLDDTIFVPQDPYHAMRHFARFTEPGWVRVDAASTANDLLVSAWRSPENDAVTVILVNATSTELNIELDVPQMAGGASEVTRSAFSGVERSAKLGNLSPESLLKLPPRATMTVAFRAP